MGKDWIFPSWFTPAHFWACPQTSCNSLLIVSSARENRVASPDDRALLWFLSSITLVCDGFTAEEETWKEGLFSDRERLTITRDRGGTNNDLESEQFLSYYRQRSAGEWRQTTPKWYWCVYKRVFSSLRREPGMGSSELRRQLDRGTFATGVTGPLPLLNQN